MQLNTDNEGEQELESFDFDEWVARNGLVLIKGLLVKHKMTSTATLNTSSAEFFQFMSDPEALSKFHAIIPLLMSDGWII